MTQVQHNNTADNPKPTRTRRTDNGPEVLSHMAHFVRLTRRIGRPNLLVNLIELASATSMAAGHARSVGAGKTLPMTARNVFFARVADLQPSVQLQLERAAERVTLLCDEYGALAVADVLDAGNPEDAKMLAAPSDKFSRALYLFLVQEGRTGDGTDPGTQDRRFDHAEARQQQLAHTQSEKFASHYLGPKGVQPKHDAKTRDALKVRLATLFPHVKIDDMVMDCFVRRDTTRPQHPIQIFTLNVAFNGSHVHFQQVEDGEVRDHDELAVTSIEYSWQPDKGALVVYCDDRTARTELAVVFRDVVLDGSVAIASMPMREFDLSGFSTPALLERSPSLRLQGIDSLSLQHIVVAKPQLRHMQVRGKEIARVIESDLRIRRHRFDERSVYQIASQDLALDDLSAYRILGVKLTLRIAPKTHRPAHTTTVEITLPNGFSDRSKTEEDSELIFSQLIQLGCARQY